MSLFIGINEDTEGCDSNGAGKSSTVEAITLALTGEVYRGLTKEHYVRTGEESCEIRFDLYDTIMKRVFTIQRVIYAGNKSSKLDLSWGNKPIPSFESKNKMKLTAQDYIYEQLGFTKEDLFNFFIIGQDNENSFFSSTDTKQKEVISRFSNYTKVDVVVEKIKEDLASTQLAYNTLIGSVEIKINQRNVLKEQLEELENAPDDEEKQFIQDEIDDLVMKIENADNKFVDLEKNRKQAHNNMAPYLEKTKGYVANLQSTQLNELKKLKKSQETVLDELKEIRGQLATRTGMIVACPKCKWQFIPNDDMTAAEVAISKAHVDSEITLAETTIIKHDKAIIKIKDIVSAFETLAAARQVYEMASNRIKENEKVMQDYETRLKEKQKELKDHKPKNTNVAVIESTKIKIKTIDEQIHELAKDAKKTEGSQADLNFHLFSFSKQFRTYISNKTIRTIQDITNYFLQLFKIDLRVFISGFKVNKDGTVRDKIEIWVIKNGKDRVLFRALSGGEKARVKLCGVFALKKLINNAAETGGLDLLCLDEMLSSLDETGQQFVIDMLEAAKTTSILIMHHASDLQCKNKVTTVKKNGVSQIVKKNNPNILS